jgi:zinc transporter 1/2/3
MITTLTVYKWIAALLIFMVSALLPNYFIKRQTKLIKHGEPLSLGEAFAAGIFLGAAFFHLLPDASHLFHEHYPLINYPVPSAVCLGSVVLFFLLERFSLSYRNDKMQLMLPRIVITILILHALTEGAALGIGTEMSEVIMLSIAIIAHKGSEGFALAMVLLRHGWSLTQALRFSLFFAAMTPLGILLGANLYVIHMVQGELLESLFSAFAAGTFIYIGALHHLHGQSHAHDENIKRMVFVAFGAIIMGLLALVN